jgi:two-component system, chemotaxis family, chemotaxis protein CheY
MSSASGTAGKRILLVDDSMVMRKIQRIQLQMLGITHMVEARDGTEALEELEKSWPIDIVLLDLNMPNMDGLSCLKAIRKNPRFAKLTVVICSPEAEKGKVVEALKAGASNYIIRPFTPEMLREKLGLENA